MRTAVSLSQAPGGEVSRISLIANYLHEISCHNLVAILITGKKKTCKMKTAEKLRHHVVLKKKKVKKPKENDSLKNRKSLQKIFSVLYS